MAAEVYLVEKLPQEGPGAYAARCHSGTLKTGDTIHSAIDPHGVHHEIEICCREIRLFRGMNVERLDTNYGGLVIFEGQEADSLADKWILAVS